MEKVYKLEISSANIRQISRMFFSISKKTWCLIVVSMDCWRYGLPQSLGKSFPVWLAHVFTRDWSCNYQLDEYRWSVHGDCNYPILYLCQWRILRLLRPFSDHRPKVVIWNVSLFSLHRTSNRKLTCGFRDLFCLPLLARIIFSNLMSTSYFVVQLRAGEEETHLDKAKSIQTWISNMFQVNIQHVPTYPTNKKPIYLEDHPI